jgi:hypothetical protein
MTERSNAPTVWPTKHEDWLKTTILVELSHHSNARYRRLIIPVFAQPPQYKGDSPPQIRGALWHSACTCGH